MGIGVPSITQIVITFELLDTFANCRLVDFTSRDYISKSLLSRNATLLAPPTDDVVIRSETGESYELEFDLGYLGSCLKNRTKSKENKHYVPQAIRLTRGNRDTRPTNVGSIPKVRDYWHHVKQPQDTLEKQLIVSLRLQSDLSMLFLLYPGRSVPCTFSHTSPPAPAIRRGYPPALTSRLRAQESCQPR